MYRKKKKGMNKIVKAILIALICGLTIAGFAGIIMFLSEFTGWYIASVGLMTGIVAAEARMIWAL